MEQEYIDNVQKGIMPADKKKVENKESFLSLSFIPPELDEKGSSKDKFAVASVVIGGISLVSWVIILLGVFMSLIGITLATLGIKSKQSRYAKIGLGLSIAGLVFAILYAVAAARGMIQYSYFTTGIFLN